MLSVSQCLENAAVFHTDRVAGPVVARTNTGEGMAVRLYTGTCNDASMEFRW